MRLEEHKQKVYSFFDEELKPIIQSAEKDKIDKCVEVAESKMKECKWVIRQYGNTIRASAWISGLNYLCFMIATPEGEEEYDFGYQYHGSRYDYE